MGHGHAAGTIGTPVPRVTSSATGGVGVWVMDGAAEPGWKRTGDAAGISVSAACVGSSSAASVRVLAFGEGARVPGVRGSGRGRPLGHGERSRR